MALNWEGYGVLPEHAEPNENDIIISQSRIKSFMLSPHRVGMRGDEGFREDPSEAMFFGTFVHDLIEQRINGADLVSLTITPWLVERAHHLAHNPPHPDNDGWELSDYATEAQVVLLVEEARDALVMWDAEFWQVEGKHLNPINVEERVHRALGTLPDGRVVWVAGTPDFVVRHQGVPTGYDWKTAGRGWNFAKAATSPQPPVICWLMEPITQTLYMDWHFIVYNRSKRHWERWSLEGEYEITPRYVEATMRNAWQWARAIAYEVYPAITQVTAGFSKKPRPWYARPEYDPTWEISPFKYYLDDTDEDTPGVSGW